MTDRTPLWIKEFGDGYAVPTLVTDHLTDISWHNDTHPSFIWPGTEDYSDPPRLWVDHPEPTEREDQDPARPRFAVYSHRVPELLLETDDAQAALDRLAKAAHDFLRIHDYRSAKADWMHYTALGDYPLCDDCHVRGHAPCEPATHFALLPWQDAPQRCACEHASHFDHHAPEAQ